MKTMGFYVGHENYLSHAEMLVESIDKNFLDYRVIVLINDAINAELINVKWIKFNQMYPNVMIKNIQIPEHLKRIPFADKVYAASVYEQLCEMGYIWMDVDSYFFMDYEFDLKKGINLNPVDQKNIGVLYGTPISDIWMLIFRYFNLENLIYNFEASETIKTTVSQERIYPYYNIGFVVVNENMRLFKDTIGAIECLLEKSEIRKALLDTPINAVFMHQAVFSAAVLKLYGLENITVLPSGVNYPMHFHHKQLQPMILENLVHMRYDTFFEEQSIPALWKSIFEREKEHLKMTWYYE